MNIDLLKWNILLDTLQIPVSYSESATTITHNFLICKWPQYHPAHQSIGKPVEVLRPNFFEMSPDNTIIPLENISMQVISVSGSINDESVLFVVPLCYIVIIFVILFLPFL